MAADKDSKWSKSGGLEMKLIFLCQVFFHRLNAKWAKWGVAGSPLPEKLPSNISGQLERQKAVPEKLHYQLIFKMCAVQNALS